MNMYDEKIEHIGMFVSYSENYDYQHLKEMMDVYISPSKAYQSLDPNGNLLHRLFFGEGVLRLPKNSKDRMTYINELSKKYNSTDIYKLFEDGYIIKDKFKETEEHDGFDNFVLSNEGRELINYELL